MRREICRCLQCEVACAHPCSAEASGVAHKQDNARQNYPGLCSAPFTAMRFSMSCKSQESTSDPISLRACCAERKFVEGDACAIRPSRSARAVLALAQMEHLSASKPTNPRLERRTSCARPNTRPKSRSHLPGLPSTHAQTTRPSRAPRHTATRQPKS